MGLRAYFEQQTTIGTTDRLEIHIDGYSGNAHQMIAERRGFTFQHSEITSESNDGFLSPLKNKIQIGKLDFYPHIRTDADRQVLFDISDAEDNQVLVIWKIDGDVEWKGYSNSKLLDGQESKIFNGRIRADDFEILKGIDYPLSEGRQTWIQTLADLFGYTGYGLPIQTSTSWIIDGGDSSKDFLQQAEHDVKALRKFKKTGDETDETINVFQALQYAAAPALLIRQQHGKFLVEQLTAFEDPTSVLQTTYDTDGSVSTASATVDRTQTIYTSKDLGSPHMKGKSGTGSYPAIKQARVKYDHRTEVAGIQFESFIELDSSTTSKSYSQLLISDGDQTISISALINAEFPTKEAAEWRWELQAENYWWDQDDYEWKLNTQVTNFLPLSGGQLQAGNGDWKYFGNLGIETAAVPADADRDLIITFYRASNSTDGFVDSQVRVLDFTIINAIASENSTSIDYQLTQPGGYSESYSHADTIFGDGPVEYSPGAISIGGVYTSDDWARRGESNFRNFHRVLLEEVINPQRGRAKKTGADIVGGYDPELISQYNGDDYYYVGGRYTSVKGRYEPILMRINIEDGVSDEFEDLPKFDDAAGSGSGTTSGTSSGGTDHGNLSGLDDPSDHSWALQTDFSNAVWTTPDNRYYTQSALDSGALDDRYYTETEIDNFGFVKAGDDITFTGNVDFQQQYTDIGTGFSGSNFGIRGPRSGGGDVYNYFDAGEDRWGAKFGSGGSFDPFILESDIFPDGDYQNLGTGDNVQFNEVEVGGNWKIDSEDEGGVERLRLQALGANDPAELFLQAKGSANAARITVTPSSSSTNFAGFTLESNGTNHSIESTVDGNESLLPIKVRMGATDAITVDTSGDTEIHGTLTGVDADFSGALDVSGKITAGAGIDISSSAADEPVRWMHNGNRRYQHRWEEDNSRFASYIYDDNGDFVSSVYLIDQGGDWLFNNTVTFDDPVAWTTPSFQTGFLGNGARLFEDASEKVFETDVGFFRSALFAMEFIINQITATQGSRIAGPGRGKVEEVVSATSGSEVVDVSDPEGSSYASFVADDIVLCLNVRNDLNPNSTNVLTDSGGVITKRYVRKVASVNGNEVTFTSATGAPSDAGSIAKGDVIVAVANTSDPNRQNILYETVIEPNAPYTAIKTGLDSWDAYKSAGNLMMKYGNLNSSYGFTSDVFGFAAGSPEAEYITVTESDGLSLYNTDGNLAAYLRGTSFHVGNDTSYLDYEASSETFEVRGVIQVTGGNAATKTYASDQANTARNEARFDLAQRLGYADYSEMASLAAANDTLIDGGFIRTSLIQTSQIAVGDLSDGTDYALKTYAESEANDARNEARADIADRLGYTGYSEMVAEGAANDTLITGGLVRTSLIDADAVFANVGSFDHLLTVGTSHELDGLNDTVSFANGILTADDTEVGLAGWTATANQFSQSTGDFAIALQTTTGQEAIYVRNKNGSGSQLEYMMFGRHFSGSWENDFGISAIDYNNNYLFRLGGTNQIAGANFDATDLWGFPSGYSGDTTDKSNASVRLDFANGRLFYDAMVYEIYNPVELADYGENSTDAADLTDEEWSSFTLSIEGSGPVNNEVRVLNAEYIHRFGFNNIMVKGLIKGSQSTQGGATITSTTYEVRAQINGETVSVSTSSSTYESFEIMIDLTGSGANLSVGNKYNLEIIVYVQISGNAGTSGDSDQFSGATYLREDVSVLAIT